MTSFQKSSIFFVMSVVLSISSAPAYSPNEFFFKALSKSSDTNMFSVKNMKANPVFAFNSNVRNSDDEKLIGNWQIKYRLGDQCDATLEFSFGEDKSYTSNAACDDGSIPFQAVGTWKSIRAGLVQIDYSDWEPKYGAMGQPIEFPRTEKIQYRFINNNRMIWTGRTANRIN